MRTAKPKQRQEPVRIPRQARAQKRVEQILRAAKTVVARKGYTDLKMTDVAAEAGITISSMYQYFPNNGAVISAICEEYLSQQRSNLKEAFRTPPGSLDEVIDRMETLMQSYYQTLRGDRVLKKIWSGASIDKSVLSAEFDDTLENVETVHAAARHFVLDDKLAEFRKTLTVLFGFANAAVNQAVDLEDTEGQRTIEIATRMLRASWNVGIHPLVAARSDLTTA
ncbi:TetR/AcrR family transcriptional regulator [Ruegeria hyattellae]|uniref:TetR/AcrR family transcriptional regulator n=1 Tax=Ruegeria hyattellae TaxID=3233337 RepID=UPI00355AF421